MSRGKVLWEPPADTYERSRIGAYLRWLDAERGLTFGGYHDLWEWSVRDLEGFWSSIWDHFGVQAVDPPTAVLASRDMPGARWFPDATLNYAAHALAFGGRGDDAVAVVARSQSRPPQALTIAELRDLVGRTRAGLDSLGVGPGDRVAAYLPNGVEAVAAFLATASLGAVWSSCAPEFGVRSVVDRFQQIEPSVLLAVDGYRYGEKAFVREAEVRAIEEALPTLRATVLVRHLGSGETAGRDDAAGRGITFDDLIAGAPSTTAPAPVPFDHPLYVLYSSGTTGLPKPIVHGHGGILLEHLKILGLHHDLGPDDRFFWFSTTGWMMWNYLVSGLALGATIVLFDGDPVHPDELALWRMAAETGITYFGTSAPYLMACRKSGIRPGDACDLSAIRGVGSTGAPLPADGFRWVYDAVGSDLVLSAPSGGTDVCTAFVGGVPILPVTAGEITCRCLGAKVEAYDPEGRSIIGEEGELVITEPMPSMPIGFWGDADGSRYRAAYFESYPGVWRHGDWITITERGTCTISGRSDATLNRGGVRVGTADFYAVVEAHPGVADSLVVHLEDPEGGPGQLLLFVVPAAGCDVDERLRSQLVAALRTELSPRHVPDQIHAVPAVPRTLSGKKLEVPVKRILTGTPIEKAAATGALVDPSALEHFLPSNFGGLWGS